MALDDAAFDGQFLSGKAQSLLGIFLRNAGHLEDNATGFDDRYPKFWISFSGAHADFSRFFRYGFVGENANPQLTAALDASGHRFSGCLDLSGCDPGRLQDLQTVVAELNGDATGFGALHAASVEFAVFSALGH